MVIPLSRIAPNFAHLCVATSRTATSIFSTIGPAIPELQRILRSGELGLLTPFGTSLISGAPSNPIRTKLCRCHHLIGPHYPTELHPQRISRSRAIERFRPIAVLVLVLNCTGPSLPSSTTLRFGSCFKLRYYSPTSCPFDFSSHTHIHLIEPFCSIPLSYLMHHV